jgi:hypothetical protein
MEMNVELTKGSLKETTPVQIVIEKNNWREWNIPTLRVA